jgi:hypothetical protein
MMICIYFRSYTCDFLLYSTYYIHILKSYSHIFISQKCKSLYTGRDFYFLYIFYEKNPTYISDSM